MPDYIDYSQYSAWMACKWLWYEKYVLRRQKKWPQAMRDDALAVGSLVHAGLENWYGHKDFTIPNDSITETNPTPEALRLCKKLVYGYVQAFPSDPWNMYHVEKPIRFPLIEGRDGLAKLDCYYHVEKPMRLASGVDGYDLSISPGWWIQEYKTKGQQTSFADFMKSWQTNMQADFQMLALSNGEAREHVKGLIINVIEKPRDYIPKRKCGRCEEYYAFSAWIPSGEKYVCPMCGNEQKLKPLEQMKDQEARYFRLLVERSPFQLTKSLVQIKQVAREMLEMERSDVARVYDLFAPNKSHCMDLGRYHKECDFFKPHLYGVSTIDNDEYEETRDYIKEKK